jgi:two-component system, OmpR family, sensor histidine kinase VicK
MCTEKTHAEKDILYADQEGTKNHEQTEMLIGAEVTTKRMSELFSNVSRKFDSCANSTAPSIAMTIFRDAYKSMKSRGIKIRWVTDITKDNLTHCKDLMQYAEVRHISYLNENFRMSETEYIEATTTKEGLPIPKLIYSNSKEIIGQQQYIFETLWDKAVPAEHRIKEIEQEIESQRIAVIYDARQALELYHWLIMSAEKEIKVVFPTTNALIRQDKAGILFLLQEAAAVKKCQVKILMPNDELIHNFIPTNNNSNNISTRFIDHEEGGKATILIVDNKVSFVMELKDDSKETFHEAIGLSTYSNSKAGVLSYVSMFESLWKQTELYEKLKSHEKMQKEFINIAAHELRTPIVPILNLSELLYSSAKGQQRQVQEEQQKEMLEIILRNANRLHQLTEDIMDVTRIESQTLQIRKERFNLNDAIVDFVEHYRKQIANGNVKVMYEPGGGIILVEADRQRLIQVISNLLNNAIKFTKEGTVTVTTSSSIIKRKEAERDAGEGEEGGGAGEEEEVVIAVKDTGTGIDPELMPRLFTKFATKSYQGTGLGLYISKSIIEAHGGRMWAENNSDEGSDSETEHKGATFYFTVPVVNINEQTREQKNEEGRLVKDNINTGGFENNGK